MPVMPDPPKRKIDPGTPLPPPLPLENIPTPSRRIAPREPDRRAPKLDPNAPPHPDDTPETRRGRLDPNTPEGQYDPPRSRVPRQPEPDPGVPRQGVHEMRGEYCDVVSAPGRPL